MVNILLVKRNWLLGKRIVEEESKGESRAEYGKRVIPCLAERLTAKYGQGFAPEPDDARLWYEREAVNQAWSVRTLQRNIASQYYFRLLQSPAKDKVEAEMKAITAPLQDKLEYMRNPVVAEFLGFHNNTDFSESDLEQSILNHLTTFLMELGKGFAFVDRQKHIHTEKSDYLQ